MKNAKGCFGSDVVARNIRGHVTQLDLTMFENFLFFLYAVSIALYLISR